MFSATLRKSIPIAVCLSVFASISSAQTETILHNFVFPTGVQPYSGLIADEDGNLYGTTITGGTHDSGVLYKLDRNGNYSIIYGFTGRPDARSPGFGLVRDKIGNFYGTTQYGGVWGFGAVFKVDASGHETILHSFTGGADGGYPLAAVSFDAAGLLYGTTFNGGAIGAGVVFRLDHDGRETVLHSFMGGVDGSYPYSGVTIDAAGNLYGTSEEGGTGNNGLVYKLDPSGQETILYAFSGGSDGANPSGGLLRDSIGNLYGVTYNGGRAGNGVVYKIDPGGRETVVHRFNGSPTDGSRPESDLAVDSAGNLYGTTFGGGTSNIGAVYRIDALTQEESLIYSFSGLDGAGPEAPVLIVNNEIYGTTYLAGPSDRGVIFKISPAPLEDAHANR